jgi:hypothetical protein
MGRSASGRTIGGLAATAIAIGVLASPVAAGAATQVGATFAGANAGCGANITVLQSGSPGAAYAAPSAGVITSWSFQATSPAPAGLKFKVGRPAGGNFFTIVGESPVKAPVANALNTYTDVRIPVQAGDVIGYAVIGVVIADCARNGVSAAFTAHDFFGDAAPGPTPVDFGSPYGPIQYNFSALLEPDADNDGFGDETQDCAPGDALKTTDCAPPDTQITKGPKDKTKRKQATFEFTGTDARAVAGFECSLDSGAFAACTSPHTVKVKKGKHTFSVRATDQAANADASPATDDWKVKKKKK